MKTQPVQSKAHNLGPFINLILTLAEQRTQTRNERSSNAAASSPLPVEAISAAIDEVANHEQPARRGPIVLGPFLATVFTLAERKGTGHSLSTLSTAHNL